MGIFDADVYGPSLPTMVNPEVKVLEMDAETRAIYPTEYLGVQLVSFGFAGQGSAIMRGAMVSGLIQQMLTTAQWGKCRERGDLGCPGTYLVPLSWRVPKEGLMSCAELVRQLLSWYNHRLSLRG